MARPRPRTVVALLAFLTLTAAAASASDRFLRSPGDPLQVVLNDMRKPAGQLRGGVLAVQLEAREGDWHPEGGDGPVLRVAAFGEVGKPLQNPGPLLRVPAGTEVRATVRNQLSMPLTVYGLGSARGFQADSTQIEPGGAHEFRFIAAEPGLYYYAGRTMPAPDPLFRLNHDSQLNGALVVDPADVRGRPRDRLFMITGWATLDSSRVSGLGPNPILAINGAMWPHTERFDVTQGDSLHWRWLNPTFLPHPLHLHGFYFRLDARGDGATYSMLADELRRLAVTETVPPGGTLALSWSPDRPGNWIFHCHFASHMATEAAMEKDRRHPETIQLAARSTDDHSGHQVTDVGASPAYAAAGTHGGHDMAGLVLGIRVKPRGPRPEATGEERALRLLIRSRPKVWGEYAGYGFALGGSPEERQPGAFTIPGPTLVLQKGQPVAVTLVNQSHEPAAVHWHGVELESFPDGVPGWSGYGKRLLPAVPPGDSLIVRFTPPRAGTFMYHSHFNEFQQIGSGMYGPLIVLEPGERYDPQTDRIWLFSDAGPLINLVEGPFPDILLNGSERPTNLELEAGVPHRIRLISIGADALVDVALLDGDQPVSWRLVAKDGAELPPAQAVTGPAQLMLGAGEIYDVELTPARRGELTLRFGHPQLLPGAPPLLQAPVPVR